MVTLKDDIQKRIDEFLLTRYDITDAYVVPDTSSVTFGGTAKKFFARVLYLDLRQSRQLLANNTELVSLRAHKAFIYAAAKCIRAEGGELRSFAGDSALAFFIGSDDAMAKHAVRAAMKTKYVISELINPLLKEKYEEELDFGAGIGQGDIFTGKSGVAGDQNYQDLIWIGWPVYHAVQYGETAKKPRSIWISKNVYNAIKDDSSMTHSKGNHMWVDEDETFPIGTFRVYKTSYWWSIT